MLKEYTCVILISDRVKNPASILEKLLSGHNSSLPSDIDKYVQLESITDADGKKIAELTVIDWGL